MVVFDWFRSLISVAPTLSGDITIMLDRAYRDRYFIDYDHGGTIYRSWWNPYSKRSGNWVSQAGDPLDERTFDDRFFIITLDKKADEVLKSFLRRSEHTEEHRRLWITPGLNDMEPHNDHAADPVEEEQLTKDDPKGAEYGNDGGVWRLLTEDG